MPMRMNYRMDGRNPYGSRGGYVDSRSDYRRDYNDMNSNYGDYRMNDYRNDYANDYNRDYGNYRDYGMNDYNGMYEDGYREYRGYYGNTPFELMQSGGYRGYPYMDRRRDYADQERMLSRDILEKWSMNLLREIDEKDKDVVKRDKILRKAEELGINFDKFSPDEFYIAVLMEYTDYSKVLGNANIDVYVRMAKAWLCDEDVSKRYGEKLASYFHNVVNARM